MIEKLKLMQKKWKVDYDGPSRPIIIGPEGRMFSISKFIDGKWQTFEAEDEACQILADAFNILDEKRAPFNG